MVGLSPLSPSSFLQKWSEQAAFCRSICDRYQTIHLDAPKIEQIFGHTQFTPNAVVTSGGYEDFVFGTRAEAQAFFDQYGSAIRASYDRFVDPERSFGYAFDNVLHFAINSYNEVNPEHHSDHSAWETPDPGFWTKHGYTVVRADKRGLGQSPSVLDTMSRGTSEAFSNGKVGLLGISYYAGSQWRVAARQPKGLACIIPWEGMSDYYRDRCRHGGTLSNAFIKFWWDRQVVSNQYGLAGRAARDLSEEELVANRNDQNIDNLKNRFRDDPYYSSKEYNMEAIKVPLLGGGILLHLSGNVMGYLNAGSNLKYLRFITGRHDLPFYYKEKVEVQKSFLDAFLKGEDKAGWSTGEAPKVDFLLRKGNVGFNNAEAEKTYGRQVENE
ncbi:unnamed protein product [Penicillium discolor]